ncbi:MAG: bifunctional diaminohydroxyphosphoribosylaminopyrimidine deaminase/5-amino-6-(5-phosphoribosylamino)uracil reductase RibD [Actinobacteria bacterium]|nr:bifunctional diaminohydroxyphosphoribosylaminopyrimidine deaminase/5-amino-6-(5-phosphoribosylamino)uracil reductase RibD [Actinomycetota bacterium]MBW3649560.1 bifunctional diaminohydroxyphosphoribosylaminopyrimidine deaminase/5-amino-6-(5-phosphoribosylamino)uracil reductase RibD [Actinomycetota bacterium]
MRRAIAVAEAARHTARPNPWVGAVLVPGFHEAATAAPGGAHAEAAVVAAAGADAAGATVYVTVEPCCYFEGKRTPACATALIEAGVRRVVVGMEDPDPRVAGRGLAALRDAGVAVEVGLCGDEVRSQLAPYVKHRTTGRPYVILKLAATLDGRTAAPDGSSRWITGDAARADVHRLRAESDAVLVGAATVRCDDPALTVRHVEGPSPRRVVLGRAPAGARVHPCDEVEGDLEEILDRLGREEVLQLLVEGGATVAGRFHRAGLVDRYVLYLAPALMGGDDGTAMLGGPGAATMAELWRGRLVTVERLGDDLKVVVERAA